jgi:hypothetical protein
MKSAYLFLLLTLWCGNGFAENLADLFRAAHVAYKRHQYAQCSQMYVSLINKGSKEPDAVYNAAGCFALSGDLDSAFAYIDKMCASDFVDIEGFLNESDFKPLHGDPRWTVAVNKCRSAEKNHIAHCNLRLYELYLATLHSPEHWVAGNQAEVLRLISTKKLQSASDFLQAAVILIGNSTPEELALARSLALKAVIMNPDLVQAKAFAAVAYDRFLWSSNRAQVYGTQIRQKRDGKWTLEPLDQHAVSDEQRSAAGVSSLKIFHERIKLLNEEGIE